MPGALPLVETVHFSWGNKAMGRTRNQKHATTDANAVMFHEIALDSDQSAAMKRDMVLARSIYRAELKSKHLMIAARALIVMGLVITAVLMVTGALSEIPAGALALAGLFATPALEHVANEFAKERSAKLAQVKVVHHISEVYAQYAAGDTVSKKLAGYISLLTHQSVQIGNIVPYTLRVDTTNESNYVVRMFSRSA